MTAEQKSFLKSLASWVSYGVGIPAAWMVSMVCAHIVPTPPDPEDFPVPYVAGAVSGLVCLALAAFVCWAAQWVIDQYFAAGREQPERKPAEKTAPPVPPTTEDGSLQVICHYVDPDNYHYFDFSSGILRGDGGPLSILWRTRNGVVTIATWNLSKAPGSAEPVPAWGPHLY